MATAKVTKAHRGCGVILHISTAGPEGTAGLSGGFPISKGSVREQLCIRNIIWLGGSSRASIPARNR